MDSQILPNAVEYLLTPLRRLSSPDQFMPAAALAQQEQPGEKKERNQKLLAPLDVKHDWMHVIISQRSADAKNINL